MDNRTGIYLIGYIAFMSGMLGALWKSGALDRIGLGWTMIGVMVVLGIGLMTSASSSRRANIVSYHDHESVANNRSKANVHNSVNDKKNTDKTTIIGVMLDRKISVYNRSYMNISLGITIYAILYLFGLIKEIDLYTISLSLMLVVTILVNQKILEYRIKKGYYGDNLYEMKEIISFITEHSDKNDFSDGDKLKKVFPELEENKQKIFSEGVVYE